MSSREVFREFEFLLDKSQRSFNRLRDLPPYGNSRWEHYFHKAFHIYSKLWKFQQDNREVLTSRGMERWEIGDIASKIGQLYYNYYLRTSEIRFLHESYVFYEAIRSRSYFANSAVDPNLAIKQLRYFARFIIICLLLNRREEVWQLLQEFQALISSYIMKFSPPDAQEWRSVIQEITNFLHADVAMPAPRSPAAALPFRPSLRASPLQPEMKVAPHRQLLHDAVLVSYYPRQVKIAELPLDSFRMLQALEWDDQFSGSNPPSTEHPMPLRDATSKPKAPKGSVELENGAGARGVHENPTKHLVYRPTSLQLLSILTTSVEVMPRDAILLLYISASGARPNDLASRAGSSYPSTSCLTSEIAPADAAPDPNTPDNFSDVSGPTAGALLATGHGGGADGIYLGASKAGADASETHLVPEDLLHLTRRSLFLVVDSDASGAFARLAGQEVGRQCFCLMSPPARPYELSEACRTGNLLTLFLTGPLMGFCLLAGNMDPSVQQLMDLQSTLGTVMGEWAAALLRAFSSGGSGSAAAGAGGGGGGSGGGGSGGGSSNGSAGRGGSPWQVVFRDALLRRLVLRFILFRAAVALHTSHGTSLAHYPKCFPELPREASPDAPDIAAGISRLAACIGRAEVFGERSMSVSSGSPMSAATNS